MAHALSNYEYLKPIKQSIKSSALKHYMATYLLTILYTANLDMTLNLRTDEMVFFRYLTKIDTDENKAIHSIQFPPYSVIAFDRMLQQNRKQVLAVLRGSSTLICLSFMFWNTSPHPLSPIKMKFPP